MDGPSSGGFLDGLRQNETLRKLTGGHPELIIFGVPVAAIVAVIVVVAVTILGIVVNLLLNLWWLPKQGMLGAALAAAASQWVMGAVYLALGWSLSEQSDVVAGPNRVG